MEKLFETGCCPRFDPGPWEEKEVRFENKLFYKDSVRNFFHIPLNFGKVMTRSLKHIERAGAATEDALVLSDSVSPWRSNVYIAVDKEVPGSDMERISGTYLTKVFEGPYSGMRKYMKQATEYVHSKGKKPKKFYFYYVYCPKCAKAYGENYTVILSQV